MTKQVFITAIEAIRIQIANDKAYSYALGELLKSDVQLYDNSKLIKSIIELLHMSFPRDEDGFSEIEFYCFESDFGKVGYDEFLSSEGLWDKLTMSHKFNPAPYENLGRITQEAFSVNFTIMPEETWKGRWINADEQKEQGIFNPNSSKL